MDEPTPVTLLGVKLPKSLRDKAKGALLAFLGAGVAALLSFLSGDQKVPVTPTIGEPSEKTTASPHPEGCQYSSAERPDRIPCVLYRELTVVNES